MCPRLRSLEWRRRAKAPIHLHRCEYATLQQSQAICKPKSGCGRSSCELGGRLYDSIVRLQPDDSRHHAGGGSGCCQRRCCGCREITQASRHYSGAGGGCCSCATRRGRRRGRRRRGRADGGDADGGDAEGQQRRFIWQLTLNVETPLLNESPWGEQYKYGTCQGTKRAILLACK